MTESRAGLKVEWISERRAGVCEDCGGTDIQKVMVDGKLKPRCVCGGQGKLIVRHCSVRSPNPPTCLSFRCLWNFVRDSIYIALLANYHRRRVSYAESNRNKKILERYRTGEPSPKTIWQAIHANTKLTCPVCRKYNVDPLLFNK